MTHLDLFSGIGGFSLAARWAGIETIAFCEIDPYAQKVLIKNLGAVMADAGCDSKGTAQNGIRSERKEDSRKDGFRNDPSGGRRPIIHPDIFKLNGTDYRGVNIITGGFPCQPFSCAGKRRGKEDDRFLWPEMLRVIAEARPDWVLVENVAGIINLELDRVLSDLESIGYSIQPFVIPACAVDAKHRRDRVWIVGHTKSGQYRQHANREWESKEGRIEPQPASQDVADAMLGGLAYSSPKPAHIDPWKGDQESYGQWEPEPDVGRVAHGIPARVHRLKCLGNAIVPKVAFQILSAIKKIHSGLDIG